MRSSDTLSKSLLLADESLTEEQQNEVIQRLAGFNKVKVTIARKLQRLIL